MDSGSDQVRGHYRSPPGTKVVVPGRQIATGAVAHGATASATGQTAAPGPALVRLADRLRVRVEDLVRDIPEDTLRRTRYPVKEQPQPDGTTAYEHDLGIVEGRISSVRP